MKNFWMGKGTLALASVVCCLLPMVAEAVPVKQVVKAAMPSVVEVHVLDEGGKAVAGGSGVIVGRSGLIVTNYHVVKGAVRARVVLSDGETVRVTGVREVDPERDFAILQVEAGNLPVAALGDSSKLESGDEVIAIGAPLGLSKVVTTGIVSRIWIEGHRLIQHTAPISPGNSGGPLLNSLGQVVGLNTFLIEKGQSMYFALPIQYVKMALGNLSRETVSLREVSVAQEALDKEQRTKAAATFLEEHFYAYEDPDGLFKIMLPKVWRVQRSATREKDGSVTVLFMASHPNAEQARLNGWLSAGIRIRLVLPPAERRWSAEGQTTWAKQFVEATMGGYSKVVPSDPIECQWGGREGVEVILGGTVRSLSQPELASLAILPAADALIAIELALPVAEQEAFQALHKIFVASFSLGS